MSYYQELKREIDGGYDLCSYRDKEGWCKNPSFSDHLEDEIADWIEEKSKPVHLGERGAIYLEPTLYSASVMCIGTNAGNNNLAIGSYAYHNIL